MSVTKTVQIIKPGYYRWDYESIGLSANYRATVSTGNVLGVKVEFRHDKYPSWVRRMCVLSRRDLRELLKSPYVKNLEYRKTKFKDF